jgi:hypothetical protein
VPTPRSLHRIHLAIAFRGRTWVTITDIVLTILGSGFVVPELAGIQIAH